MVEQFGQSLERVQYNKHLVFEAHGRKFDLSVLNIADGRGISTRLNKNFLLDWHDIFDEPKSARMHMYPGASQNVSFREKCKRMKNWAEAISVYDALMVETEDRLNKAEIETLIESTHLPRITTVVLDTGTKGLVSLFLKMKYKRDREQPNPFLVPWEDFVEKAKTGELVAVWKSSKKHL